MLILNIAAAPIRTLAASAGVGVIIYKDQPWTEDVFAEAVEYRSFDTFTAVTNIVRPAGTKLTLTNPKIVRTVPYLSPDSTSHILQDADLVRMTAEISELTGLIQKFPKSGAFLRPRVALLQAEIGRFRAGQVKFEGRWFPSRQKVDDILAARKADAMKQEATERQRMEVARLEAEKRRMREQADLAAAEQARAKEARMAEDAQNKAREAARQAEEDRRVAAEKELMVARMEAKQQEEERIRMELKAAEDLREAELLRYVADRFKKVDRFQSDLTEPVIAR